MTDNIIQLPLKMPLLLVWQVERLGRPPDPAFAGLAPLEPVHHPAAADWVRRKRALLKQADREACHDWFVMLCCGINGVTEEIFEQREFAIWTMCRELPDLVWCDATMRAVWLRTRFLPTPGECHDVLEAHAAALTREIEILERIAAAPPERVGVPAPPYVPPPPPAWALSGGRGAGGRDDGLTLSSQRLWTSQAPARSVAEQIAALKGKPESDLPPEAA